MPAPKRKADGDVGAVSSSTKMIRTGKPGRPRKLFPTSVSTPAKPSAGLKRRTAAHAEMETLLREKKRQLVSGDNGVNPLLELERTLVDVERRLAECKGVEQILKAKMLRKQREELTQRRNELHAAQSTATSEKDREMCEYLAMIERLERADMTGAEGQGRRRPTGGGVGKTIPVYTHLYPPRVSQKNLMETMHARDAERWQNLRTHKKRFAVMYDKEHPKPKSNPIDNCPDCHVDLVVDRELSIRVCPACGLTRQFASHIFESKETEKDDHANRQQSMNHMQKFSLQFERGHASSTPEVLEALSTEYSRVHLHDPSKVQSCRTSTLLKGLPNIPKAARRIPDRLTKELKGEGIPEFSSAQIQQLLQQRNRLRVPDDMAAEAVALDAAATDEVAANNKKSRKSFNNQIFMRQLGRSSNMEPARIFPNPKTTRIHIERTRALEHECLNLGVLTTPGAAPSPWALYPAS